MPFPFILALPTTPVSLPYGTAVTTTYSGPSVPSIKTLTQSASMGSRDISVGHQIIQNKPHPTFPGIRTVSLSPLLKFIYSEKATKLCEIFPLLLTTVHTVKSKVNIS